MRVLHIISSLGREAGGPTTALQGLTAAQIKCGLRVCVLGAFQNVTATTIAPDLEHAGVTVHQVGPVHGKLHRHPDLRATVEQAMSDADIPAPKQIEF